MTDKIKNNLYGEDKIKKELFLIGLSLANMNSTNAEVSLKTEKGIMIVRCEIDIEDIQNDR